MIRHVVYRDLTGDGQVKIDNLKSLKRWVKAGGWNPDTFAQEMGLENLSEIVGIWFSVINNRLFKEG